MINPFNLFVPSYLFDVRPGADFFYFWPLIVLFVVAFLISFWLNKRGLSGRMREFSAAGLLLTFLRDQNIPYLGMRVWLVILFLCIVAYAVWFWRYSKKKLVFRGNLQTQENALLKYLPKKKRR